MLCGLVWLYVILNIVTYNIYKRVVDCVDQCVGTSVFDDAKFPVWSAIS